MRKTFVFFLFIYFLMYDGGMGTENDGRWRRCRRLPGDSQTA
jgi:hypothetical protein